MSKQAKKRQTKHGAVKGSNKREREREIKRSGETNRCKKFAN